MRRFRYLSAAEAKRLHQTLAERDAHTTAERSNANQWRNGRKYDLLPEIVGHSDHITPMVLLSFNTGMRQGELCLPGATCHTTAAPS